MLNIKLRRFLAQITIIGLIFLVNPLNSKEAELNIPPPEFFTQIELSEDKFINSGLAHLFSLAINMMAGSSSGISHQELARTTRVYIPQNQQKYAENLSEASILALANDKLYRKDNNFSLNSFQDFKAQVKRQLDELLNRVSVIPLSLQGKIDENNLHLGFILKMQLPDAESSAEHSVAYQSFHFLYVKKHVLFFTVLTGKEGFAVNQELSRYWAEEILSVKAAENLESIRPGSGSTPASDEFYEPLETQQQNQRWIKYLLIVPALFLFYFRNDIFSKEKRADADDNSTGTNQ
jgi:hypothetical protein